MATEAVEASNRTIARAAANAAEQHGDRVAVRFQRDGEWRQLTFAEVAEIVDEIALGLVGLGIERGDRVALLANTRPDWTFSSLAISRAGAVVVPIYPTNSPEECEWVAGNSDSRIVICEDAGQAAKIDKVRSGLPDLEHVILIDPDPATPTPTRPATAGTSRSTPSASRAAAATAPSSIGAARQSPRATLTRSSTRRARPERPRASCSATATARRSASCARRSGSSPRKT